MKKQRSPQEKKQLSYERDRRNAYGENDKSPRKAIPLRKRIVARTYRHSTKQHLPADAGHASVDDLHDAEAKLLAVRRKYWKKHPDMPLGEFLERKRHFARIRENLR